jgi:cell division protein ZapA
MKQVDVQIMGASYMLGCKEEAEADLMRAVRLVDSHMCKIRDTGKTKARERVAVLAALNITAELNEENATLLARIEELEKRLSAAPAKTDPPQGAKANSYLQSTLLPEWGSEMESNGHSLPDVEDLLQRVDSALGEGETERSLF